MRHVSAFLITISMAAAGRAQTPFTIAILPDTQYYSSRFPAIFTSQTQWIVSNRVSRNIAYVLHEGDITDADSDAEWQNASGSMGFLDGIVPYTVVPGNHDWCVLAICGTPATRLYNQYFPVSRFAGSPAFGGVFETGKLDNTYQFFTAGGTDWMVIGLEYSPRDAVLVWANNLADSFPNRRVIVVTHTYLYTDDTLHGSNPNHVWLQFNNNGIDIWNKFVRKHRNISFVFNGHVVQGCPSTCDPSVQWLGDSGSAILVSTGDLGNKVVQMFANWQEFGNKDTGLMRLVKLDPAGRLITVETYSPWGNYNLTDAENQFQITNVDLGPLTSAVPRPPLAVAGPDRKVRAGDTITLNGSGTVDPDGRPLSITWNFGDGTPPQSATIATHAYVTAGSYTATLTANDGLLNSVSTATVTVLGGSTLFVEDFKNGFGRWTVVNEGTNYSPSRWKVGVLGFLEQLTHTWGGDVGFGVNKPGTYAVAGSLAWTNYTFSVRVNAALGNTIGVMFRYIDANNYYLYSQDSSNAYDRRLVKREGGVNTLLASVSGGVTANQWYQLQIQLNGTNIQVFRDGSPLINVTDVPTTSLTSGAIALYSWANSAAYFDSVLVTGTPSSTSPTGAAGFLRTDTTTAGTWRGVYGADGFNVIDDTAAYPAYVSVAPSGNSSYIWASSTTDARALQKASTASDRIAACWSSAGSFSMDLYFSDTATHQVALYLLDWDNYFSRTERVDILDANNTLLDSRSVSAFTGGEYLVWNLSGHVIVRITNTNPSSNAVVSGLLFGPGGVAAGPPTGTAGFLKTDTNTAGTWKGVYGADGYNVIADTASYPAYVSVTASGNSSYIWASSTTDARALQKASSATARIAACWSSSSTLSMDLSFHDTAAHQVALYLLDWDNYFGRTEQVDILDANNVLLDSRRISAFTGGQYLVWNLSGHVIVRVTNTNALSNAVVSGLLFGTGGMATPQTGTAGFVKTDTATAGTWKGVYGADGYNVISDTASYPAYVSVTPSGNLSYIWAASSTGVRAMQKASSASDRIAACWYSWGWLSMDFNFHDTASHQVALYLLDWDNYFGRSQRVDILDANNTLLDSRSVSAFVGGQYLVWNLTGHVIVRITNTNASSNAVLSGILFR